MYSNNTERRSNSSYRGNRNNNSQGRSHGGGNTSSRSYGGGQSTGSTGGSHSGGNSTGGQRTYGGRNSTGGNFRRRRPGGGRSGGGGFNKYGGGRRGGRSEGMRVDPNLLIKKATPKKIEEYTPKHKFADFKLEAKLKHNILAKGYNVPTPIQDQSIEHALEGKDVIGVANTGTGKTAAFLIPLINKVVLSSYQKVLVIAPTRELANQAEDELKEFVRGMNVFSVNCIGGQNIHRQISGLRRHHNFVFGTPGRLKDLYERRILKLEEFQSIVLDEVDRMVDMGFIDDMRFILGKLPAKRQSLFFSATVSPEIDKLIKTFMNDPITVSVKTQATADNVNQDIIRLEPGQDKSEKLHELLILDEYKKCIIFVRTKFGADKLEKDLMNRGFKVTTIHGNKSQNRRQHSLRMFKTGQADILVATDVAARGLDIPNVSHVINYDLPATYDDYVHRIGRTGRANNVGYAVTFVN